MLRIEIKGAIVSNDDKAAYDYFNLEATCPRDVLQKLKEAGTEYVDVFINSGGGDIFAGSEIYSALRSYQGKIKIHVVGLAASAASVILCAGESDITPTGMVMVHNVSGYASGDYRQMDKTAEVLKKANSAIAEAYMNKTKMTRDEALQLMEQETWLTAEEAIRKGLVDRMEEPPVKLVASLACTLLPREVIEKTMQTMNAHNPRKADIFMRERAKATLRLLKLGGKQ